MQELSSSDPSVQARQDHLQDAAEQNLARCGQPDVVMRSDSSSADALREHDGDESAPAAPQLVLSVAQRAKGKTAHDARHLRLFD